MYGSDNNSLHKSLQISKINLTFVPTTFDNTHIMTKKSLLSVILCMFASVWPCMVQADEITFTTEKEVGSTIFIGVAKGELYGINIEGATTETIQETEEYTYLTMRLKSRQVKLTGTISEFLCIYDSISFLDVSKCPGLGALECSENLLTSLDISKNTKLGTLSCSFNSLTSLDISNNNHLVYLNCQYNSISNLDTSNCPDLAILACKDNSLTSLDVSKCPQLKWIHCDGNSITSLDLKNNPRLFYLDCSHNKLASLELPHSSMLAALLCGYNELTSLDLRSNKNLDRFHCQMNRIKDQAMDDMIASFYEDENSYKTFVVVNLSESREQNRCTVKQVRDAKRRGWYAQHGEDDIDTRPYSGYIVNDTIVFRVNKMEGETIDLHLLKDEYSSIKVLGATLVQDVTKNDSSQILTCRLNNSPVTLIAKCVSLDCSNSSITSINTDKCTQIQSLNCSGNPLTTLDVSKCEQLQSLDCHRSSLKSLIVGGCLQLQTLDCSNNSLDLLTVNSPRLLTLDCSKNKLNGLYLDSCSALQSLDCSNNALISLNLGNNPQITTLNCASNALTSLDVTPCTLLQTLICRHNAIGSLDISNHPLTRSIDCSENLISSLNLNHHWQLEHLICNHNSLTSLDVSTCPSLIQLHCHANRMNSYAIDDLIASLNDRSASEIPGIWSVIDTSGDDEQNECSDRQAVDALKRGWITQVWNGFWYENYPNIINLHITDENINDSPVSIYDIEGRKQQNLRPGFNIMKTRNGKTVKVIH